MGLRIMVEQLLGRIIMKTESGAWRPIKNSELLPVYYNTSARKTRALNYLRKKGTV